MALNVRSVDYFYTRVEDVPGRAYELLANLASQEVNLLAFSAVPYGANCVELTIFPDSGAKLTEAAKKAGWNITGPQHAFLITGDDELGALAAIHLRLLDAKVNIYASTGVIDGKGGYGYVIYVKDADFPAAAKALAA
jgi:hypothetical protein